MADLVAALQATLSPDHELRHSAEAQLKEWETAAPDFLASLLQIVAAKDALDLTVRVQAVLYFKNSLDKYWRKTAPKFATLSRYVASSARQELNAVMTVQYL